MGQKSQQAWLYSQFRDSQGWAKVVANLAGLFSGGSWVKSASKFTQVISRIQFCAFETEIPIFLMAVKQGPLSHARGLPPVAFSIFKSTMELQIL